MRTDQTVTIRRVDYTPPVFLVDDVRIELDLDPDDTRVRATLRQSQSIDAMTCSIIGCGSPVCRR